MEFTERHIELIVGFLAGNIFDWGAKEVAKMLESGDFGFQEARDKIPRKFSTSSFMCLSEDTSLVTLNILIVRPWLVDNLDEWIKRMESKSYHKVAIFVDNSGADIVLGVIPFARELLRQNTKVRTSKLNPSNLNRL